MELPTGQSLARAMHRTPTDAEGTVRHRIAPNTSKRAGHGK